MKDSTAITQFLEGNKDRFVIPVYQRRYDWRVDNCNQLFSDLEKVAHGERSNHFFGCIVSKGESVGRETRHQIIDGQQRVTTVTLLLLAIRDAFRDGGSRDEAEEIDERFIVDRWEGRDIKLRPTEEDREALARLVRGDAEEYVPDSNLTINYRWFRERLTKSGLSLQEIRDAIDRLQVILITLQEGDNAQLIFESLNSTGLTLTEGDKVRNYVLMDLPLSDQDDLYRSYWRKIEECCGPGRDTTSWFIRDWLSVKMQTAPKTGDVYKVFKEQVADRLPDGDRTGAMTRLLADMLGYARIYRRIHEGASGLGDGELDACMKRLNRLGITVTEPFFMEVLHLNAEGRMSLEDVRRAFLMVESYLLRRAVCGVPTNSLNKTFLTLNRDVLRYDGTTGQYADKLAYTLRAKTKSGRFPDDDEFHGALAHRDVYTMRGEYCRYILERLNNHGTKETTDVYERTDGKWTYTIEHIMPQTLTPEWRQALGPQADEIHEEWQHRLGNLTLAAYNSKYSNKPFQFKLNCDHGFKDSPLRLNHEIASKDRWTLEEMEERNNRMADMAVESTWPTPVTRFHPSEPGEETFTLADTDFDPQDRTIDGYSCQDNERTRTTVWKDMYEQVIQRLHAQDPSVLLDIIHNPDEQPALKPYFADTGESGEWMDSVKIDDGVYAATNNNTMVKLDNLRRLFPLYGANPEDLIFYLKGETQEKN